VRSGPVAHAALLAAALVAGAGDGAQARAAEAPTFADRDPPAAEGRDRSFALLLNPISFAYGLFGAEGDFVVTPVLVATVEVDAARLPRGGPGPNALSAATSLLVYPSGSALHAFYAGARVAFVRPWRQPELHLDFHGDVVECGLSAGWQWTWDYGLSVRLGAGPLLAVGGVPPVVSPELAVGPARLALAVDASIGWAF
jgi:hypothetical protein